MKPKRVVDKELLRVVSKLPCLACPMPSPEEYFWILSNMEAAPRISDPHHVTSRGAGGGDTATNVMPLCRGHHNEWEAPWRGPGFMVRNYPRVREWLYGAERFDVLERLGVEPRA
jgi:hypothetical protein